MSNVSFLSNMVDKDNSSTGGGGTTNYDKLTNQPVQNISGVKVNLSTLNSGVYNISGTWCMCADDAERNTPKDDLFFVDNSGNGCNVIQVSARRIYKLFLPVGGTAADIEEDAVTTANDIIDNLVGQFGGDA